MVKFSEVRKTYEASKYVPYWRKVGGIKAPSVVKGGGEGPKPKMGQVHIRRKRK